MGACASVPKAMRYEAANIAAPELREEEASTTTTAEETIVATMGKAEGGNDSQEVCL